MLFSYKKDLVINYFYYAAGFIIPGILSFLLIPFILRNFGAGIYAQYSIAFNTLSVVTMFCYGWIGHSYIRFYSATNDQLNILASKFLFRSLLAGFAVFACLIFLLTDVSLHDFVLLIPAFFLSGYYSFKLMVFQAKQKAKKIALSEIIRTVVNIGIPLCFTLLYKQAPGSLALLLYTLSLSYGIPIIFVLSNPLLRPVGNTNIAEKDNDLASKFKTYGIPVAVFLSLALALSVNDRFIIAKLMGNTDAGNYAAVYDILNKGVGFICTPVIMTFYPYIVKQYNEGSKEVALLSLKKSILLEILIFLSGLVVLYFAGNYLLQFVLKDAMQPGTLYLSLLIYAGVFAWQLAMLLHKPLELRMQTKHLAIGVGIAFAVNIAANYYLIGRFHDVTLAAYTTIGSSLLYIIYVLFFSLKKHA